jgi:cysteine desulfurase
MQAQAVWRDQAEKRLAEAGAVIVGAGAERLPNTLCFAMPGFGAELQVMGLDLTGVMVSSGAACSSGKVRPSHVLSAMGLAELAGCAVRASGGWATKGSDWDRLVEAWIELNGRHAARRRAPAA